MALNRTRPRLYMLHPQNLYPIVLSPVCEEITRYSSYIAHVVKQRLTTTGLVCVTTNQTPTEADFALIIIDTMLREACGARVLSAWVAETGNREGEDREEKNMRRNSWQRTKE